MTVAVGGAPAGLSPAGSAEGWGLRQPLASKTRLPADLGSPSEPSLSMYSSYLVIIPGKVIEGTKVTRGGVTSVQDCWVFTVPLTK